MRRLLLLILLILLGGAWRAEAQPGPFPAQIINALRAYGLISNGCTDGQVIEWDTTTGRYLCVTTPAGTAPSDAQYWVGAAHAGLSAEKNLGVVGTGLLINTAGVPSAYAGTSCTDQFPRSLNASGAATCASVAIGSDVSGLGTGIATALAVNTGSAGAPVLYDGAGGTPSAITLTNGAGLPISTGVSGLGANVATFLATPSSANFFAAVTGETGSGAVVGGTAPTIANPIITNIAPGANFTLTQNSVAAFTSEETGAVVNTLYLKTGNVGIGTTSPVQKFHVHSDSEFGGRSQFSEFYSSASGPVFIVAKGRGTLASPTVVQADDSLGLFSFSGQSSSTLGDLSSGAWIQALVDGTPGSSDMPTRLVFSTSADGSASPTARMTIKSDGNVGIGDTTPDALLDVAGTAIIDDDLTLNSNPATGAGDVFLCITTGNVVTQGATCAASSERFKGPMIPLAPRLDWFMALEPRSFSWRPEYYGGKQDIGFSAEQLASVDPVFAVYQEGVPYSSADREILALTVRIVQDQQRQIDTLLQQQRQRER